jgi:hypothetical protein
MPHESYPVFFIWIAGILRNVIAYLLQGGSSRSVQPFIGISSLNLDYYAASLIT